MKKLIRTLLLVLVVTIGTTSCVKDYTCECTSSSGTVNEVYKNTKFVTAVDKCNDREAQWHLVNPATTCKIK
jgi:hypothetical protein